MKQKKKSSGPLIFTGTCFLFANENTLERKPQPSRSTWVEMKAASRWVYLRCLLCPLPYRWASGAGARRNQTHIQWGDKCVTTNRVVMNVDMLSHLSEVGAEVKVYLSTVFVTFVDVPDPLMTCWRSPLYWYNVLHLSLFWITASANCKHTDTFQSTLCKYFKKH